VQHFTCDLCGSPIKEEDFYTISIVGNKQKNQIHTNDDYYNTLSSIVRDIKDICPTCKQLIDEIFRLRKDNLYRISEELLGIWKLKEKDER
jgi:hypothetical protein